jgi:hypothetical protein
MSSCFPFTARDENMSKLTTIGALLFLLGLTLKTLELPVPDWIACVSLSAGLIAIIFVGGRHSLASTGGGHGTSVERNGLQKLSYEQ